MDRRSLLNCCEERPTNSPHKSRNHIWRCADGWSRAWRSLQRMLASEPGTFQNTALRSVGSGLALRPELGIKRHLEDVHSDWPLKLRREIVHYTSQLSLIEPDEVVEPPPGRPPVAGLAISDGRKCEQYRYLSSTERTMQEHSREKHQWVKAQGDR